MGHCRRMTRKYHHHTHRAAFAIAAAATLLFTSHADAQMLGQNIFGGTNPGATSVSTPTGTVAVSTVPTTATIGPGFTGTVVLNAGAQDTFTESINAGNNGTLMVQETGQGVLNILNLPLGVGVGGSFAATKAIQANFVPNQSYSFTLTTTSAGAVNLLSSFNVQFFANPAAPAVFGAATGTGLLGVANVLNLFNNTNTATYTFTAPANVDTTDPITISISGGLTGSVLNNSFSFTNATLNAVPEPGTVGAMGVGIAGLALAHFRRRLARN